MRISWSAADVNSDPLEAYEVLILTSDEETYVEEITFCDGEADSNIRSKNYCDIPMTTRRADPFFLVQGSAVIAKIRARNSIGWGPSSDSTESDDAATIQVEPHQMASPTRGELTTVNQVEVVWVALSGLATGGSTIDSYHLQWDFATSGGSWYDLQGGPDSVDYSLLTSHLAVADIVAGTSY